MDVPPLGAVGNRNGSRKKPRRRRRAPRCQGWGRGSVWRWKVTRGWDWRGLGFRRRIVPIARAGSRFTVILPAKVNKSLLRIFLQSRNSFLSAAYCSRKTVGWRQQLSRGSFDPRRDRQEKLKVQKSHKKVTRKTESYFFGNWFLLLDIAPIRNLTGVWLWERAGPAFRYRRFCALDNYSTPLLTSISTRTQKLYSRKNCSDIFGPRPHAIVDGQRELYFCGWTNSRRGWIMFS